MKYSIAFFFLLLLASCKSENSKYAHVSIHDDVAFLADDKLEGRQTGTDGERAAAEYIADRVEAMGLSPKGTEG